MRRLWGANIVQQTAQLLLVQCGNSRAEHPGLRSFSDWNGRLVTSWCVVSWLQPHAPRAVTGRRRGGYPCILSLSLIWLHRAVLPLSVSFDTYKRKPVTSVSSPHQLLLLQLKSSPPHTTLSNGRVRSYHQARLRHLVRPVILTLPSSIHADLIFMTVAAPGPVSPEDAPPFAKYLTSVQ